MFLYSNSMSVSRSLCFSSITPFSSSPSSLISFFFLCPFLHHTYPGWSEFTSPCSHPSLSLQPKEFTPMAPWAGMGGGVLWGRGFQRPAVPFHSPFPPALVPVLFCHLKGLHDLQSKHAPCHPLSCLVTGSWGDPGLEQHPQIASSRPGTACSHCTSLGPVPCLIYQRSTVTQQWQIPGSQIPGTGLNC